MVLLAGLFRALVIRETAAALAGRAAPAVRPELLEAATWRAAQSGLEGNLVDPGMAERWFCGSGPARIIEGQPEGGHTLVAAGVAAHDEHLGLHLSRQAAGQVIVLLDLPDESRTVSVPPAGSCLTLAGRR